MSPEALKILKNAWPGRKAVPQFCGQSYDFEPLKHVWRFDLAIGDVLQADREAMTVAMDRSAP